jgi:hypothetical protein
MPQLMAAGSGEAAKGRFWAWISRFFTARMSSPTTRPCPSGTRLWMLSCTTPAHSQPGKGPREGFQLAVWIGTALVEGKPIHIHSHLPAVRSGSVPGSETRGDLAVQDHRLRSIITATIGRTSTSLKPREKVGFRACDCIVKIRKGPIIDPKWKIAHHTRRQHSYWLVFRKSPKCE